ncbi:MAG: hypothetical protein SH820_02760 [Xanthomonadales bacterium]|nr:hypothetical protein [Xanthomonadales bacterium]
MRTTLTFDDIVGKALKDLAHRSGKSFKQVVNETLELGLAASGATRKQPYREKPTRLGEVRANYDLTKALSLAAALEDEELLRKIQQRK